MSNTFLNLNNHALPTKQTPKLFHVTLLSLKNFHVSFTYLSLLQTNTSLWNQP